LAMSLFFMCLPLVSRFQGDCAGSQLVSSGSQLAKPYFINDHTLSTDEDAVLCRVMTYNLL
jgi:hypothetical protein